MPDVVKYLILQLKTSRNISDRLCLEEPMKWCSLKQVFLKSFENL